MKTAKLGAGAIDACFRGKHHQTEVLLALYRKVYPMWDDIKTIDGYPKVDDETHMYISGRFIAFDRKHHPDVMPGGAWLNQGFGSDSALAPGTVSLAPYTVLA